MQTTPPPPRWVPAHLDQVLPPTPEERPAALELRAAPPWPEAEGAAVTAVTAAVPLLGAVGSVAVVVSTGHGSVQGWLMAAGVLLASLAFAAAALWRSRATRADRVRRGRRAHAAHLDEARAAVRRTARRQREEAWRRHPDPVSLVTGTLPGTRRRGDPDHLHVRYGVTDVPLALTLRVDVLPPEQDPDPVVQHALERFLTTYGRLGAMPAVLRLDETRVLRVCGPDDAVRDLVRSVVTQAVATHDPRDLAVVLLAPPDRHAGWEWLKWLAHNRIDPACGPADDAARHLVVSRAQELEPALRCAVGPRSARRDDAHVLVVVDGVLAWDDPPAGPTGRVTYVVLDPPHPQDRSVAGGLTARAPGRSENVLVLAPAARRNRPRAGADDGPLVELRTAEGVRARAVADRLDRPCADAFARRLPARVDDPDGADPRTTDRLSRLLHLDERGRPAVVTGGPEAPGLRVELGTAPDGRPVVLDLEEAAHGGAGPHGLVIGATGSGKSELLRTLVLGLVTAHRPDRLNLLLVDFKGGATFAGLRELPHVSAVITNLSDDLALVDRVRDALDGELRRRQELLGAAGGLASRHEYEAARGSGRLDLPPLPRLLVVVDEFSELLSARPELLDLLVSVGRLGRSLGLHLLLASQRLEEGRLRGLDSHLSFRIALRTFSATESRTVVGTADAHTLPVAPGAGYLRTGPGDPERFETTYVSGPATVVVLRGAGPSGEDEPADGALVDRPAVRPFRLMPLDPDAGATSAPEQGVRTDERAGPSVLEVVVGGLRELTPRARPIWLAPPDRSPSLGDLLPDLARDERLGLVSHAWRARGRLTVPLGLVDRPREQRYDVLTADLSGEAGHVAVVGGPRSGRSTTLASLVTALATTHTPDELRILGLDFGGGALTALAGLPHVSAVAGRAQPDLVRRVAAEVRAVCDAREARSAPGAAPRGGAAPGRGDVVLVVDQWAVLRSEFPDLEPALVELAQRGLSHGVHLAVAATRWAELRPALRDVLGTRIELRLGDPLDSEVDRRQAALVPVGRPGRALTTSGHQALVARPDLRTLVDPVGRSPAPAGHERTSDHDGAHRLPGEPDLGRGHGLGDLDGDRGLDRLVTAVREAWPGAPAPRLRLLPSRVPLAEVRAHPERRAGVASLLLGLDADRLAPVGLDLDEDPHLLVLGESRTGRTTALRTLLHEVARLHPPAQAQVFLVDPRRTLLGEVPDDRCADYATSADDAARLVRELAHALRVRLPPTGVTPAQLRDRSWWNGPTAMLVVDDADLLTGAGGSVLEPLLPLLPHSGDVGLHVLLARRAAGLTRRPDPVVTALHDLDHRVLLLGDGPDDGFGRGTAPPGRRAVPPGRGVLVRDGGRTRLQVAVAAGPHDDGPPAGAGGPS